MKVTRNGHLLSLGFRYDNPLLDSLIIEKGLKIEDARKMKTCDLLKELGIPHIPNPETTWAVIRDDRDVVAEVSVKKHKYDPFDKEAARRFALNKLLNNTYPGDENKQTRADFWNAYIKRKS